MRVKISSGYANDRTRYQLLGTRYGRALFRERALRVPCGGSYASPSTSYLVLPTGSGSSRPLERPQLRAEVRPVREREGEGAVLAKLDDRHRPDGTVETIAEAADVHAE